MNTQKKNLRSRIWSKKRRQDGNSLSIFASKYWNEDGLVTHRDTVRVFGSDFR